MELKVGQRVRAVPGRHDWSTSDSIVTSISSEFVYIKNQRINGGEPGGFYPENLIPCAPLPTKKEFKVGDRVQIKYGYGWDGPATVDNIWSPESISVKTDKPGFHNSGAFHPKYLTLVEQPVQFTLAKVPTSVDHRSRVRVFGVAKEAAVKLAKQNFSSLVSADDVQDELRKLGYSSLDLGNAAGNLFRGKNWKKVSTKKSTRSGNNAREISVWKYIGA
jgi:hypothetical protein